MWLTSFDPCWVFPACLDNDPAEVQSSVEDLALVQDPSQVEAGGLERCSPQAVQHAVQQFFLQQLAQIRLKCTPTESKNELDVTFANLIRHTM
jgi:hypothetical protein